MATILFNAFMLTALSPLKQESNDVNLNAVFKLISVSFADSR
ncbi:MAG: hypothetical protein ACTS7E_02725 [Arsenophonus sp. NC-CH8-MAG3]